MALTPGAAARRMGGLGDAAVLADAEDDAEEADGAAREPELEAESDPSSMMGMMERAAAKRQAERQKRAEEAGR